ncbi:MAG: hypothetical protein Q4A58_02675 [Fusobacterium sp.]|uniref:hypothetical protein n=1 Tax=Fusobacterium sp. TaxID=68766 RepID=UPI0026DADB76|nr:hypothetical protein [Fusobacterium sp.]MDO4690181.1 hypothetical protein [Fusobacterium sp.]
MSNYSQLLKKLLHFSETKFIVLANTLGYDISYISKWCSGSKTPSSKSINTIHKKMSALFAQEINLRQKGKIFLAKFNLEFPKEIENTQDIDFLKETIFSLLNKTYYSENPTSDFSEREEINFIFGKDDTLYFLEEKLKPIFLQTSSSEINFYFTLDFTITNVHPILSLLSKLKREEINIRVNMGTNLKLLEENSIKKLSQLFHLLNCYSNLNIELYDISDFNNMNFILVKNHIALQYSIDTSGKLVALTSVQEKMNLDKITYFVLNYFKEKNCLLRLASTKKMRKEGYRTAFYTSDYYNFFLVQGFEFLLPPAIINNIAEYAKKNYSEQDLINILRVKIIWEEFFENASINFFLLRSSIFQYLEKGELTYMNIPYQMSIEERKSHFDYAIKLLEKNPKIHFYIIDDEFISQNNLTYNIGIFGNYKKMFFKNYYSLEKKKEPYFTIVNNKKIINQVNFLFETMKNSEYCTEYTIDKLKTERHESMFLRLTEL